MILHSIVPGWNLPDVSPYVTKLDCYLRLTRTDYTYAPAPEGDSFA